MPSCWCHPRNPDRHVSLSLCLALLLALWVGGLRSASLPRATVGAFPARDVSHVGALAFPVLAPAQPTVRSAIPNLVRVDHVGLSRAGALIQGLITAERSVSRSTRPPSRLGRVHPPCSRAPPSPRA